jgi:hypothetical protein
MIFRITALGIGAIAMYYFDPDSGKRRRSLLRDQLTHLRRESRHYAKGTLKHARNRAHGVVAEARSAIERRREQRSDQDRRTVQHWPVDPVDIDLS